jgi:hypothetical protein
MPVKDPACRSTNPTIRMAPYVPKYVSPKQAAQNRARRRTILYWAALIIPLAVALIAFGYSDQAPGWLRAITVSFDGTFGFPILRLVKIIMAP